MACLGAETTGVCSGGGGCAAWYAGRGNIFGPARMGAVSPSMAAAFNRAEPPFGRAELKVHLVLPLHESAPQNAERPNVKNQHRSGECHLCQL